MSIGGDQRWPKQFGDFAEQLTMNILGRWKGMSVALVDHVGADLFATPLNNNRVHYAISVKGRIIPESESKQYTFEVHDIVKLKETAETFGMEPALALVVVFENEEPTMKLRIFFSTLEKLNELCESADAKFIGYGKEQDDKGNRSICFRLGNGKRVKYLEENFTGPNGNRWSDYIDYTELSYDRLDNNISFLK